MRSRRSSSQQDSSKKDVERHHEGWDRSAARLETTFSNSSLLRRFSVMLLLSSNLGRMTAMYPSVEGCYGARDKNAVRTLTAGFVSVGLTERQACEWTDKQENGNTDADKVSNSKPNLYVCTECSSELFYGITDAEQNEERLAEV